MPKKNPFVGTWRITEMEQWDKDYIDEEVEAYIRFDKEEMGEFQFGCVRGVLDWEIVTGQGNARVDFSWEGDDEMHPVTGRGWARIEDNGGMFGRIAFHQGDRSWFRAERKK
jgi:hypothetical protein